MQKKHLIGLALILLGFAACKSRYQLSSASGTRYKIQASDSVDQSVVTFYQPYKMQLDSQMNKVIVFAEMPLEKARPEGLLGNYITDRLLEYVKIKTGRSVEICYLNHGGLRAPLPKGNVTVGDLFELMPFENELVILTVPGTTIRALLDKIAARNGDPLSGVRFTIKDKTATGIMINGAALDEQKTYTVLTSDYLANGGDGIFNTSTETTRVNLDAKLRDALIEAIQADHAHGKTIKASLDGRIQQN